MRTAFFSLTCLAVLIGGCRSWPHLGDEPTVPDVVVVDSRAQSTSLDLSDLPVGKHTIELVAYVPKARSWLESDTATLKAAIHARRLTPTPADVDSDLEVVDIPGRSDKKNLKITLSLDSPGSWYLSVRGSGVGYVDVAFSTQYAFDSPTQINGLAGVSSTPTTFLRTVGTCRHPVEVQHRFDAEGTAIGWTVRFSQNDSKPPPAAMTAKQDGGAEFKTPFPVKLGKTTAELDVDLPMKWTQALSATSAAWRLSFPASQGGAGEFNTNFTCEAKVGDVSLVTWFPGLPEGVMPKRYFVSFSTDPGQFGKPKPGK